MPDSAGVATTEEINHYQATLIKAMRTLKEMSEVPIDKAKTLLEIADFKKVLESQANSYFTGVGTPLKGLPGLMENAVNIGVIDSMIEQFEAEVEAAKINLDSMKHQKKNHPMNQVLKKILKDNGSRDDE